MGKRKKENDTFLKKNTTMISVDGKGTVFPMQLKLQEGSFEKT